MDVKSPRNRLHVLIPSPVLKRDVPLMAVSLLSSLPMTLLKWPPAPSRHKVCLFHHAVLWVNPFPAAFFLSGGRLRGFMDGREPEQVRSICWSCKI